MKQEHCAAEARQKQFEEETCKSDKAMEETDEKCGKKNSLHEKRHQEMRQAEKEGRVTLSLRLCLPLKSI